MGYCEHKIASSGGYGADAAGEISGCIVLPQSKLQSLIGNSIARIDVGLISRINVRDLTVWVRSTMDGENLASATIARGQLGWNEVRLDTPYPITPETGNLYIGFTYANQGSSHPVSFVNRGRKATSFFRSTAGSSWQDMKEAGNLSIEAIIEGQNLPPYDPSYNSSVDASARRRNVLLEEFTTERCPNCPRGAELLHNVLGAKDDYRTRVIPVCHHSAFGTDDYTQDCDTEILSLFNDNGQTFAPAFMFNRLPMFDSPLVEGQKDNVTSTDTQSAFVHHIEEILNSETHATVSIHVDAIEDNTVTLTIGIEQDGEYKAQNPRLTLYTTEDDVYCRLQAGPDGNITDYRHNHLIRTYNSSWGDEVAFENNQWSHTYTITIEDGWKKEDLHFVAFVSNYDADNSLNNAVENAASIDYNTAVNGVETILTDDNTVVARYSLDGTLITTPQKGINIVRYSNGTTQKVLVK